MYHWLGRVGGSSRVCIYSDGGVCCGCPHLRGSYWLMTGALGGILKKLTGYVVDYFNLHTGCCETPFLFPIPRCPQSVQLCQFPECFGWGRTIMDLLDSVSKAGETSLSYYFHYPCWRNHKPKRVCLCWD